MKTILLVDDSPTVLMMGRMLLGTSGYRLLTASNGLDAVAKAQAEKPDLILLDAVMPRLDGFEACRQIRALPETRTVPILMVTTRSESESIKRAYSAGCTDYLTKPFVGPELLKKVRSLLGE